MNPQAMSAHVTQPDIGHRNPMLCRTCDYDLRNLPAQACPECGRAFNPADPKTFTCVPRQRRVLRRTGKFLIFFVVGPIALEVILCFVFYETGSYGCAKFGAAVSHTTLSFLVVPICTPLRQGTPSRS